MKSPKDKSIAKAIDHAHRLGLDPVVADPLRLGLCIDPREPVITLHNKFGECIGGWRTETSVIAAAEALKATGIKFDISPVPGVTSAAAKRWRDSIKVIEPIGFAQIVGRGRRPSA